MNLAPTEVAVDQTTPTGVMVSCRSMPAAIAYSLYRNGVRTPNRGWSGSEGRVRLSSFEPWPGPATFALTATDLDGEGPPSAPLIFDVPDRPAPVVGRGTLLYLFVDPIDRAERWAGFPWATWNYQRIADKLAQLAPLIEQQSGGRTAWTSWDVRRVPLAVASSAYTPSGLYSGARLRELVAPLIGPVDWSTVALVNLDAPLAGGHAGGLTADALGGAGVPVMVSDEGFANLLHELGHALGLQHVGGYDPDNPMWGGDDMVLYQSRSNYPALADLKIGWAKRTDFTIVQAPGSYAVPLGAKGLLIPVGGEMVSVERRASGLQVRVTAREPFAGDMIRFPWPAGAWFSDPARHIALGDIDGANVRFENAPPSTTPPPPPSPPSVPPPLTVQIINPVDGDTVRGRVRFAAVASATASFMWKVDGRGVKTTSWDAKKGPHMVSVTATDALGRTVTAAVTVVGR